MRRRAFLSTAGAGTVTSVAGCVSLFGSSESVPEGPPRLSVDGRWLTDPDGNRVVLRGVNVTDPWWGTTYADIRGKDYWETLKLATDEDEGWHTRVLRVPIEPRSIREVGLDTLLEEYVDRVVELTRERDVYVILDYHTIDRYDTAAIDNRIRRFWSTVAPRYADEPHVLYELFNEPTKPSGNGMESWRNWRDHAQPWVDMVRNQAPETPLIIGSPQWSAMPRFATEEPFEGDHLIYSGHVFPSWNEDTWEPTFGDPALEVPVFITEWGYINVDTDNTEPHMIGSTDGWGTPFREWLDSHENVNWSAWTFDTEWVPKMFDHDWNLLGGNGYMGQFTKDWLTDKRNDHQPGESGGDATVTKTSTAPSPPSKLRVVERRPTSVAIAWDEATDADGDDIVQYRVSVDGEERAVLRGSERSVDISQLESGAKYEITVVAVDDGGVASEAATLSTSTVELSEPIVSIPRTSSPPTIDGSLDYPWADVDAHAIENVILQGPSDNSLDGEWRAVWDESALYYLIDATDSDASTDSDAVYRDDSVEIYLDPDNSRHSGYDGENDAQLLIRRGETTVTAGANSVDAFDGMEVAQTETDDGYRVEVAIPWEGMGTTPEVGHELSTDVHVNDDIDGGDREAKIAWFTTSDEAWKSPQVFAVVELGE